jgi:acyl-coenzyme A synthetase/AMP-(fatty) acid ligase
LIEDLKNRVREVLGDTFNALRVIISGASPPEVNRITATGVPKGAILSNAAIVIFSLSGAQLFATGIDDVIFAMIEATGTRGLREGSISPVICGGATVIADPARRRDVLGFADICRIYGVTQFSAVPATLRRFGQIKDRLAPDQQGPQGGCASR